MQTVARYQPAIDLSAWIRSATTTSSEIAAARDQNLQLLGGDVQWAAAVEYGNARQALRVYFEHLAAMQPGGEVLLPAQICFVAIEAVRLAGLTVRFIDGDGRYPTPSALQYLEGATAKTVAMVVSPLYGYLQDDWRMFRDLGGHSRLILDLAQGLTLFDSLSSDLVNRADAVVYSFGIGKGIDTGGGLLLARAMSAGQALFNGSTTSGIGTLLKSIAVRAAIASGAYGTVVDRLESASEAAKIDRRNFVPQRLRPAMHLIWRDKMRRFRREVALARNRAVEIQASGRLRERLRDTDVYCDRLALHLRQIVRLRNAAQRDLAIDRLRKSGIDCAAAGEALPAAGSFPNAGAFASDAIRLPFLGRLSEQQFVALKSNLEIALDEHLSS